MFPIRASVSRLFNPLTCSINAIQPNLTNFNQVRNKPRYYFPFPTEVKRVRKQGFLTLVKSPEGRRKLMQEILKKKKVIAH